MLFGLLLLVRIPGLKPIFRFVGGIPILAGIIGASWYLFTNNGILLDVIFPAISAIVLYILLISIFYVKEEAHWREVRRAFGHYIAPELVEQLANDTNKLNLGGEIRQMSILFLRCSRLHQYFRKFKRRSGKTHSPPQHVLHQDDRSYPGE